MKQGNILLIGGGLLLLYWWMKKNSAVQPETQTKNLQSSTSEQPVLVSPLQQVTEQVSNKIDNSGYRVKYIAGTTHYI